MSQWITCSELMPECFTDALITDGESVGVKWWDGDKWDCWSENDSVIYSGDITTGCHYLNHRRTYDRH